MNDGRAFALIFLILAGVCSWFAWQHLQTYVTASTIPLIPAVRAFVPVFILLVLAGWFWFRG